MDATPEQWKSIPGYVGSYEASNLGNIRSLDRPTRKGRVLKQAETPSGYRVVSLCQNGKTRQWRVHQLVLMAFVGPPPEGHVGCHENDIPHDNRLENIRWDTPKGNTSDILARGRHPHWGVERCKNGHAFTEENTVVNANGRRRCRECNNRRKNNQYRDRRYVVDRTPKLGGSCPNGHEYTLDNVYMTPSGDRNCRTCRKNSLRRSIERRSGRGRMSM